MNGRNLRKATLRAVARESYFMEACSCFAFLLTAERILGSSPGHIQTIAEDYAARDNTGDPAWESYQSSREEV